MVLIIAFGNAFYILTQYDVAKGTDTTSSNLTSFGSFSQVFLSLFSAMTGQYTLTIFTGSTFEYLGTIVYVIYVVLMSIVMLNMLIAVSALKMCWG